MSANAIHPGDVKTNMWADIKDKAERGQNKAVRPRALPPPLPGAPPPRVGLGRAWSEPRSRQMEEWAARVAETGGDPPEKSAQLCLEIIDGPADVNGRFLWIESPAFYPTLLPSWDDTSGGSKL
eukprot:SAG11_NODE_3511_length_2401_cov_1.833189_2_plen_124_part_00